MGRGANGSHPVLDLLVTQWPSLILVPAVLCLIAVLAAVTRWWDGRDEARTTATNVLPWRRRARCTCSWHTVDAGAADAEVRSVAS